MGRWRCGNFLNFLCAQQPSLPLWSVPHALLGLLPLLRYARPLAVNRCGGDVIIVQREAEAHERGVRKKKRKEIPPMQRKATAAAAAAAIINPSSSSPRSRVPPVAAQSPDLVSLAAVPARDEAPSPPPTPSLLPFAKNE